MAIKSSLTLATRLVPTMGSLILVLIVIVALAAAPSTNAQAFTTLANLDATSGANSTATLVQGPDGELYGTTYFGGGVNDRGTVFRMSPAGTLTALHAFSGADGRNPIGGLVLAGQGGLIGTTAVGGAYCPDISGCGTVFRVTVSESFSTIQSFDGVNGQYPEDTLTLGNDGNYYGTTRGINTDGAVVKITPGGSITAIHNFGGPDGSEPIAGLALGGDGNFYGTTCAGGTYSAGTVFTVTPAGTFTTLHIFGSNDGACSVATLALGADGKFYGTTGSEGINGGGTVFSVTPAGTFTVLHSFNGTDGTGPGALALGTDGNFYGATSSGGTGNLGTVFQMTSAGNVTVLHDFTGADGENPYAGLVQHTNGNFYGVTGAGGSNGYGTIFSLNLGLAPFVSLQFPVGKVGSKVGILGQGFTGATAVTFNGTAASFTIISDTYLTAVVPSGATTGLVKVTTTQGTLMSNHRFQIR